MDGRTLMAECFSSDKAAMSAAKVGNIRLPLENWRRSCFCSDFSAQED